jgi:hypothetical protein
MKKTIALCCLAVLQGCAFQPMTPEQQEYMRQVHLENLRAANERQAQPYYQIVQPAPMPTVQPLQMAPLRNTVTATWTGKSERGRSVTGASGFNCEYYYAGKKFWRMYSGNCPSSIEVQ